MEQALDGIDGDSYTLAPDVVLTPAGPVRDHMMVVRQGKIASIERRNASASAITLPDTVHNVGTRGSLE